MRTNTLKQKLRDGKAVFRVMITFPAPPVVELLGYVGSLLQSAGEAYLKAIRQSAGDSLIPLTTRPDGGRLPGRRKQA